jgi:hypothetical protein
MNFRLPAWRISRDVSVLPVVILIADVVSNGRVQWRPITFNSWCNWIKVRIRLYGPVARRLLCRRMCNLCVYFSCCRRGSFESPVRRRRRAAEGREGKEGGGHAPPKRGGDGDCRRCQTLSAQVARAQSLRRRNAATGGGGGGGGGGGATAKGAAALSGGARRRTQRRRGAK